MMPSINTAGYNVQAAVDRATHLIVAAEVVCEANDTQQFAPMHQQAESHLPEDRQRRYNMDAGYHSFEQLNYIEQHQIDAVIADPQPQNRATLSSRPPWKNYCKTIESSNVLIFSSMQKTMSISVPMGNNSPFSVTSSGQAQGSTLSGPIL